MAEKAEKQKQTQVKHIPKDAQVIMSIMKEMNVTEYEPRVINQLLEFSYKYVACVLEDAKTYANHAKKKNIDLEDVKLALQIQLELTFTSTPPRNVLSEMARIKNNAPLPLIKPHCGIRLPPDRFCLSNSNVKVKLPQLKKGVRVTNLIDINMKKSSKVNIGVVKRANNMPMMSRTQAVTIPKPVSKFTNVPPKTVVKPKIHITQSIATTESSINASTNEENNPLKRKREIDNEFDM